MRYLPRVLLALVIIMVWEVGLGRFYAVYLAVASENLLSVFAPRCVLHLEPMLHDLLIFHRSFAESRSIHLAGLVAPAPFVFAVLVLRRHKASFYLAALCILAGIHLATIQAAVQYYSSTVFAPDEHSRAFAEVMGFFHLVLYQPVRFAQVPFALFIVHQSKETSK